jgi:hypothetical protein
MKRILVSFKLINIYYDRHETCGRPGQDINLTPLKTDIL